MIIGSHTLDHDHPFAVEVVMLTYFAFVIIGVIYLIILLRRRK